MPSIEEFGQIAVALIFACIIVLACSTVVPKFMLEPTPTATPAPTPTPRHVALPSAEDLAYMIAAEAGSGFHYLPWHYVAEDSVVWLIFGWPEQDDRLYKAVFGVVGGEWALLGVEPVGEEETREASVDGLNEQATDFH